MDYSFPKQLFPSFYNNGPPGCTQKPCAGIWGSYDQVQPQGGSDPPSNWTFTSRHQVKGEIWRQTEPAPIPLFKPNNSFIWSSTPPDPHDFTEHMQNFYSDHCRDAFGCISEVLGDNFYFKYGMKKRQRRDAVHTWKIKRFLDKLNLPICHKSCSSSTLQAYSALMSDVVHTVPPELLGSLLYEELTEQRDRRLFYEGATGGALNLIPFSQSEHSQNGCLLFPGNQGMDRLNFHRVEWEHHQDKCFSLKSSKRKPFHFQLKGPIRQISSASLFNICCVSARSDRFCGFWRFSEREEPHLLQVVNTKDVATCITVSPHILGEVLVASESGTVNLWTVGKGIQKVWEDISNLYFNAKSSWRWCEFSAHPRVIVYADRTGAELCDIRACPASNHTLFRISNTADCRSGERLILSKYLADVHPFHHLVNTQYSTYIMDERFPCLPVLKMDHMMQFPPVFCHVLPGGSSSRSGAGTTKVLLGSQCSQEITQLQYSGGRAEPCISMGPPQALLRPCDSLQHLPVQIPHRMDIASNRLSSPSAGLTCIQKTARDGNNDCIYVLQLTEAGDIFYQILEHEHLDASLAPASEDKAQPRNPVLENASEAVPETSSNEDIIGPTRGIMLHTFVTKTPEKQLRLDNSDNDSEDSETRGKGQNLKRLNLQIHVNDDPGLNAENENGTSSAANDSEQPSSNQETRPNFTHANLPDCPTFVKLSEDALSTWKRWLQKLMHKSHKKDRMRCQMTCDPSSLFSLSCNKMRELSQDDHVTRMRHQLSVCMSDPSLLVRSAATSEPPEVVPFPDQVDTGAWVDDLSRRLTLAWQGEENWRAWWKDRLGLNREEKMNALRRKRRRQREARMRSGGRRLALSESFTSSVTYQSELDDFSDWTGWSSAASQGVGSDSERVETELSQSEGTIESEALITKTPVTAINEATFPTPIVSSRSAQLDSTPSSQRRSKRPAEDYLSSLFGSQDDPAQHDTYFDAEQQSLGPLAHSSQSLSQSSLGRLFSQPKKKKARMGF
ncbi:TATA box-binding protein-associated factor RNA polymerase I subunit C [Syngnathus acus]|uniref:TATA box-binding protein-associated factor RNA polymerase I subunit C n=1 Tax=Syngnathus acus TaxID=161584 RepID=UPI001885E986|nr:TATA box-binding protein-associated factor RNA polymerase I subunit C [Syngnathus acus]